MMYDVHCVSSTKSYILLETRLGWNRGKADDTIMKEAVLLPLQTPCVHYAEDLYSPDEADALYQQLYESIPWEKTSKINRWVFLMEETPSNYQYRDAPPSKEAEEKDDDYNPFSDLVRSVQDKVAAWVNEHIPSDEKIQFNVCLLNFYQDGSQAIGWHADREELGRTTPIASLSLGAERTFSLQSKVHGRKDHVNQVLASGSLVVMENVCQEEYLHCIPKESHVTKGRINLTFRCKHGHTSGERDHERRDNFLQHVAQDSSTIAQIPAQHDMLETPKDLFGSQGFVWEFPPHLDASHVVFVVTCNLGTERYTAAEVSDVLLSQDDWTIVARPWGIAGTVACACPTPRTSSQDPDLFSTTLKPLLDLRSALYVLEYQDHFSLTDIQPDISNISGEDLYQFYKQRLVNQQVHIPCLEQQQEESKTSFRVTTVERCGGPHLFSRTQVEQEIGGAVSEYYSEWSFPQMTNFDVNLQVNVLHTHVLVGRQCHAADLSKRHFVRYKNGVTLKTNLAYIMNRLAGVPTTTTSTTTTNRPFVLADPCCGSGTLLLEAMEMSCNNNGNNPLHCVGMDVSRKAVQGARKNVQAVVTTTTFDFWCCDARALRKHLHHDSVDAMVSNLPWGIRTGHHQSTQDLQQWYEILLRTAWYALKPHGRLVLLVLRGLFVTRLVYKLSGRYRILSVHVVRTTNNLPSLIVLEKLPRDVLHDGIKAELADLSQYVNVSKEIFHAIHSEQVVDDEDES